MFMYCKKCCFIKNVKKINTICPACDINLEAIPKQFLTETGLMFTSQSTREEFENFVRSAPDYDENAALQREIIITQKDEIHKKEIAQKVQEYKNSRPQKSCPVCRSTSISKISNVGKIVKVSTLGILGAGDLGKTWKCEACGCKF